jgi:protein phosphatase-4 regulatory subunit 3
MIAALRFFRHCLGVSGDVFANRMMKAKSFEPIIDILVESSPRNSLLNSAVLELLQFLSKVYLSLFVADGVGK